MKWILISDSTVDFNELGSMLRKADEKCEILKSDFKIENLQKLKKDFKEAAACAIFVDEGRKFTDEELLYTGTVIGALAAEKVRIITNSDFLYNTSLYKDKFIEKISSVAELISYIEKEVSTFAVVARKRIAITQLLENGIPFTSDCFATYIAKNKEEVFEQFIAAGIDVNSRDDSGTPMLNVAIRSDNFEFMEKLIQLGADINAVSTDRGYTPVMDAVWRGNEKITDYLIKKGADLNTISKEGQSNLVLAVGADRINIVKLLAENGSDPDVKDMMGMSAYQYATLFKKEKIVEILKPFHKE